MKNFMSASFFGAVGIETTLFVRRPGTQVNQPAGAECACSVERSCLVEDQLSGRLLGFCFPFEGRHTFRVHPGCLCRRLPHINPSNMAQRSANCSKLHLHHSIILSEPSWHECCRSGNSSISSAFQVERTSKGSAEGGSIAVAPRDRFDPVCAHGCQCYWYHRARQSTHH